MRTGRPNGIGTALCERSAEPAAAMLLSGGRGGEVAPLRTSARHQRQHPQRAAAAVLDLQRRGDQQGTRRRQPLEIAQAGAARTCRPRAAGCAPGTAARSRAPGRRRSPPSPRPSRGCRAPRPGAACVATLGPGTCGPSSRALRNAAGSLAPPPVGAHQHPRAGRDAAVPRLPGLDVARARAGSPRRPRPRPSSRSRRPGRSASAAGWCRYAPSRQLPAGDPVHRRVEMRAGVLAAA